MLELSDEQRWRLCEASLEALAAVHNADWRALGLGLLAPPDGADAFDAEVANWRRPPGRTIDHLDYYEAWAGVRLPILMHRAGNLMIDLGCQSPSWPSSPSSNGRNS